MTDKTTDVATIAPPRLPYPKGLEERFGIDRAGWKALVEAVWPMARTPDSITLALSYCRARKLDPFKRPIHIVPMWNAALQREVETVWPGISEHRTTAIRTNQYAGTDPTQFGPMTERTYKATARKTNEELTATVRFPEWAQITVYRLVGEHRVAFPGPRIYFDEAFGLRKGVYVPNERWARSPSQMLEKVAEAAALRKAFPEEIGSDYTADEMEDRMVDITRTSTAEAVPTREGQTVVVYDLTSEDGEIFASYPAVDSYVKHLTAELMSTERDYATLWEVNAATIERLPNETQRALRDVYETREKEIAKATKQAEKKAASKKDADKKHDDGSATQSSGSSSGVRDNPKRSDDVAEPAAAASTAGTNKPAAPATVKWTDADWQNWQAGVEANFAAIKTVEALDNYMEELRDELAAASRFRASKVGDAYANRRAELTQ